MSGTTSVPQPTLTATGYVAPLESAILTGVTTDINAALGGNANFTNLETPQGQIASSQSAIVADAFDQFLFISTQTDPAFAQGRMQDAIGRIYFITRNPATSTVVQGTLSGLNTTVIPAGFQVEDTSGNLYASTVTGTISSAGTVVLPFACLTTGPIVCGTGALNTLAQYLPGIDSVSNGSPGAEGNNVESRNAFEERRSLSVGKNGQANVQAIRGAVLSLTNVIDAYVNSNDAGTATTIGGVSIAANTLYVAVVGGAATDIANAIWTKKPCGIPTQGNTSVVVYDTSYAIPQPSYTINFQIPSNVTITIAVNITNSANVPSNGAALVQAAILSAFAGADGGQPAKIGATVYAARFYAPVAVLGSWARIVDILLGTSTATGYTATININQFPVAYTGSIIVNFV